MSNQVEKTETKKERLSRKPYPNFATNVISALTFFREWAHQANYYMKYVTPLRNSLEKTFYKFAEKVDVDHPVTICLTQGIRIQFVYIEPYTNNLNGQLTHPRIEARLKVSRAILTRILKRYYELHGLEWVNYNEDDVQDTVEVEEDYWGDEDE